MASHELSLAQAENLVFGGIDETREPLPPNVPPPSGDTTNQYVVELEGSDPDKRVGTSLLLQVMAGDRFQLQSLAFYGDPEDEDENVYTDDNSMLNAIFTSFVNGFNPAYAEEGWGAYEQMGALFGNTGNMSAWNALKELETDPDRPRAYLNYMVFDNNMELVADQSGVIQVGATAGEWSALKLPIADIEIQQNGYLGVYLSNEQFRRVWFDNVYLVHYRGRLIEEHHYYPHGLTLGDVVAAGHEPNPYLYQGKKLQGEGGLKLYDFHARQYDAQIGRFWGVDPADQFPSGYTGMGNDPANMVDPTGMIAKDLSAGSYTTTDPYINNMNPDGYGMADYILSGEAGEDMRHDGTSTGGASISGDESGQKDEKKKGAEEKDDGSTNSSALLANAKEGKSSVDGGIFLGMSGWDLAGYALDIGILVFDIVTIPSGEAIPMIAARRTVWAATKTGTTVLGHYPQYVKVAETIGARTFQIPTKIWNKMTPAQQWEANQKFLDRMILRGDNIRLATPLNQVKPGSFFQKELNYLFDKGYKVSSDGLWLVK